MDTRLIACRPRPRTQLPPGFTLLELLVVLAIGSVLAVTALPSLSAMLNNQKSVSFMNLFVASLNLARGEAIKRNARTVVCKSATGDACASAGGWEQGWIVFHDANNNARLDGGERVLQHQGGMGGGPRLTGNQNVSNYVSYSASGSAKMVSGAFQAGTFTLCPVAASATPVRQIMLSPTGRARVMHGSPADCA